MQAPILYPYQRRYLADGSRWKAAMWSRQTGKTFTTTLEAVLDCQKAEEAGRNAKHGIAGCQSHAFLLHGQLPGFDGVAVLLLLFGHDKQPLR